ncbi:hypothetical protein HanIR_Chr08g0373061 [Helianthus annuus]|nr:hypothetical protein HanIR_Chr08g0373061 [Helianthus annuus]
MARRGTNTDDSSDDVGFRQRAYRIGHCTSLVCPIPTDLGTVSVSMTLAPAKSRNRLAALRTNATTIPLKKMVSTLK